MHVEKAVAKSQARTGTTRMDATREDTGSYLLLRDSDTGLVWSAGYQPTAQTPAA